MARMKSLSSPDVESMQVVSPLSLCPSEKREARGERREARAPDARGLDGQGKMHQMQSDPGTAYKDVQPSSVFCLLFL